MFTHPQELEIIRSLQQLRSEDLDAFMKFLNVFDTRPFYYVAIPFFALLCGWRTGLKLLVITLLSLYVNVALKHIFLSPRPFHLDESLAIIQVSGYGFPSGAAQSVILYSCILIYSWNNRLKWAIAPLYIGLISLSRVYMGLHFPTDILGGWCVGFGLWLVYKHVLNPLDSRLAPEVAG